MLPPALVLAFALLLQEPSAAPHERGLTVSKPGAAPGYVLFSPLRARNTYLIDAKGEVVHTWDSPHPPLNVHLLADGTLLRAGRIDENPTFFGGGLGGRIQQLDKDGGVLWEYVMSDEKRSTHHGIEPLPNGNVLAIAWEHLTYKEAVALGRDPRATNVKGWWPCWVLEIRPTPPSGGEIVWEWHALDHLVQDADETKPSFGSVPDRPERIDINADHRSDTPMSEAELAAAAKEAEEMRALGYSGGDDQGGARGTGGGPPPSGDWLHVNSVDYDPTTDLIVLSTPELCEIWVIDHSTTTAEARTSRGGKRGKGGDLLYRWGNPRMYGLGAKEDQRLFYQHQADWVPAGLPGAGHVTLFNNGSKRPGGEYSSIEELALPFDPARGFRHDAGQPFEPQQPAWSYSDPDHFYSFFISGCQRLPNGNTFVCSGKQGRFFELTPAKEIVWEYWQPFGGELEMGMGRAGAAPPGGPPPGGPGGPPPGGPGGPGGAPPPNPVEPTSCFRATKLAPDHPGLKALGIVK